MKKNKKQYLVNLKKTVISVFFHQNITTLLIDRKSLSIATVAFKLKPKPKKLDKIKNP